MRLILSLALLFFLPGLAVTGWNFLAAVGRGSSAVPLAVGTIGGILLERLLRRKWPTFEIFEHELAHAVASLLWLRPVTRFVVRRTGGWVSHGGGFGGELGNDFIGLAPYVLPTFTAVSVVARPWVPHAWHPWFDGWIGVTFGFHLWSTIAETRANWHGRSFQRAGTGEPTLSDIGQRGFVYSAIYIATVTLAIHGVLLAILLRGYPGTVAWARGVWQVSLRANLWWFTHLEQAIRSALAAAGS